MSLRSSLPAALAAVALGLAACGEERAEDTGTADSTTTEREPAQAPDARVTFVTPDEGATVDSKFTARVKLTDFTIDTAAIGKSPQPGRGHLHFSLDGGRFDIPEHSGMNGQVAKDLGVDGKYSPAGEPQITYDKIPPGKHVLRVTLANNNHTDTGVSAEVELTVAR